MARTKAIAKRILKLGETKKEPENTTTVVLRKKRRFKPGTVAKREIIRYTVGSKATVKCIPKSAFERLVREVAMDVGLNSNMDVSASRFEKRAMEALHEGTEAFLVDLLKKSNRLRQHRRSDTLSQRDLVLAWADMKDQS